MSKMSNDHQNVNYGNNLTASTVTNVKRYFLPLMSSQYSLYWNSIQRHPTWKYYRELLSDAHTCTIQYDRQQLPTNCITESSNHIRANHKGRDWGLYRARGGERSLTLLDLCQAVALLHDPGRVAVGTCCKGISALLQTAWLPVNTSIGQILHLHKHQPCLLHILSQQRVKWSH